MPEYLPVKCPKCGKQFYCKERMLEHLEKCTGPKQNKWSFSRKKALAVALVAILGIAVFAYANFRINANTPKTISDPHKTDSSGLGIDDWIAVHSYWLDPHNQTAIREFLAKIPNVTAHLWNPGDVASEDDIINYSMADPLIRYLAERSQIVPSGNGKTSLLLVSGLPAYNSTLIWPETHPQGINHPSYFFTHGRNGVCFESAMANIPILRDMGYKAVLVIGQVPGAEVGHAWAEAYIKGAVYVVNYNTIAPRDGFYERFGWTIDTNSSGFSYSPNWYL